MLMLMLMLVDRMMYELLNQESRMRPSNEHNTSNWNIHKLDAAFDINPLFHTMPKNFDEGGAKGLSLAN